MTLRGIDVSKWQGVTPDLTGLSFLFARASIGTQTDEKYAMHYANARHAGLVVGAYHFNHDAVAIDAQVKTFLAAAGNADLLVIDVEGKNAFNLAQTKAFIKGVKAADPRKRKVVLYMSDSGFYLTAGQDANWVANWSHEPVHDWSFWQYRGSPLDLDRFAGTAADLAKMAGIPTAPDTGTQEDAMKLTDVKAVAGKATMKADGPCWRVADEARVDVKAGATWEVAGTAGYKHTATKPNGEPGYMIRARAEDGELHIVAQDRVTFVPAPLPKPLPPDSVACKPLVDAAVAAAVAADRARAKVVWS